MGQVSYDVVGVVSVWTETVLYGIYVSLFVETVYITVKRRRFRTTPQRVFFTASILIFGLCTAHIAMNLYRLLAGFVWYADTIGPDAYFGDVGSWDNITADAINAITTWTGDFLVIYRCYIIWGHNWKVVLLPALLLCSSIVANTVALHRFAQLGTAPIFSPTLIRWMDTIYSVAFVQNTMTTGLIAFRIWQTDRTASRYLPSTTSRSDSSLLPIARIIIESAALYSLEVLILIILYAVDSPAQTIVQETIVPTVGIVFTLMSLRLAMQGRSGKKLLVPTSVRSAMRRTGAPPETGMQTSIAFVGMSGSSEFGKSVHGEHATDSSAGYSSDTRLAPTASMEMKSLDAAGEKTTQVLVEEVDSRASEDIGAPLEAILGHDDEDEANDFRDARDTEESGAEDAKALPL